MQPIQVLPNPNTRKVMQVSEEALTPMHVPFIYNNECYIITQQDVRKVEDTRLLSYSKLKSNGELIPIQNLDNDLCMRDALQNAFKFAMMQPQQPLQPELLNQQIHNLQFQHQMQQQQQYQNQFQQQHQHQQQYQNHFCDILRRASSGVIGPMEVNNEMNIEKPPIVASIKQQLDWAKSSDNSSPPYPFTYTKKTSTTDMQSQIPIPLSTDHKTCQCCCCSCCCCSKRAATTKKLFCTRASNTSQGSASRDENTAKVPCKKQTTENTNKPDAAQSCSSTNTPGKTNSADTKEASALEQLKQKKIKNVTFE